MAKQNKKALRFGEPFKYWCWLQDLNPPPPDYKSGVELNKIKYLTIFLLRNQEI